MYIYIYIHIYIHIYTYIYVHIYIYTYIYIQESPIFALFVRFEYENIYTDLTGPPADETNLNDFIVFLVMICWGRFHNGFRFVFNLFFICVHVRWWVIWSVRQSGSCFVAFYFCLHVYSREFVKKLPQTQTRFLSRYLSTTTTCNSLEGLDIGPVSWKLVLLSWTSVECKFCMSG